MSEFIRCDKYHTVNESTAAYYFHRLRELILYSQKQEVDEVIGGEIELDESYFGGASKGKRGRGSAGKAPVFVLLKRVVRSIRRLFLMRHLPH